MTGEDLGLKRSTVEQAKFEYSPLGKVYPKRDWIKMVKKKGCFRDEKYWKCTKVLN